MPTSLEFDPKKIDTLRARLLAWYGVNRRDLPWRRTRDPYAIWVSEIMLQQTRVAAVLGHYAAFLKRFPDVRSLARAEISDVLAVWSGLGYYRRARAMHATAKEIVARGGSLPSSAEDWRTLPGIGRYTAAAIASIAGGEPIAVVDGNVERVIGRVMGAALATADIWRVAESWLSKRSPGDFNQAVMELGATVCLPASPRCAACPLHQFCSTRGELAALPAAPRVRRESAYVLRLRGGAVYLKRRGIRESLMPGMWELPEVEPNGDVPEFTLRHSITTTDYTVKVLRTGSGLRGGRWVSRREAARLPLTGLARKILRKAEII